jgi:hypothetical protein
LDLSAFLDLRDPENLGVQAELFADLAGSWLDLVAQAADLHPITRSCLGFHLWSLAGLSQHGDRMEAAVIAALIATSECKGAGGLRAGGLPAERLACWFDGMESACKTAMGHLDDIETWLARAETEMTPLAGKTSGILRRVLADWSLVSAPMAETLSGSSRTAVRATSHGCKIGVSSAK